MNLRVRVNLGSFPAEREGLGPSEASDACILAWVFSGRRQSATDL